MPVDARIGCGAGFAGDRLEPAVDLVERGRLDTLVLECLGERTVSLAALRADDGSGPGYDPLLRRRLLPLLDPLARHGTRLVTNAGAADPVGAARMAFELARAEGLAPRIAAVTGDDVLNRIDPSAPAWEDGMPLEAHGELVSAHAYLGAETLVPALRGGADIVIAGRAADPSLFLAPLLERLGWDPLDEDLIASGTLVGHLLECAGQVSGGYFADPGVKDVPDLAHLGFPIAEVDGDGSAVITKLPGTGGRVDTMTVTEQLTYEVTDPSAYLTPDVSLDMTGVQLSQAGPDRVRVAGARGGARPDRLKASVGYRAGFRGEGEISYAGPGAAARARLAGEVVRERLGERVRARVDLLGDTTDARGECRLRVAGTSPDRAGAEAVEEEVTALYTCGPAGGGGARTRSTEVIGILSTTIGRDRVEPGITYVGEETR